MMGLARHTDERGYPIPLPVGQTKLLTRLWILVMTVTGAAVPISVAAGIGSSRWSLVVVALLAGVAGVFAGLTFATRERDVAVPTPLAAGFVSFSFALATPFIVYVAVLVVLLATSHAGQ